MEVNLGNVKVSSQAPTLLYPGRGLPPAVQACPSVHLLAIDEPSPTD